MQELNRHYWIGLLTKFMAHVAEREGTLCPPHALDRIQFSDDEIASLSRLEDDANEMLEGSVRKQWGKEV